MKTDFHIELINAIKEPSHAKWDYLHNLRKESKLSKAGFIAKLKEAYSNIFSAFKELEMESKMRLPDSEVLGFPFLSFIKFTHLKLFSSSFEGHINQDFLKTLENFIKVYELRTLQNADFKKIKITTEEDQKDNQNKFNKMSMKEVQDHFNPLTEKKNLNGEIWMTKEDFEIFLKRSFGGQKELPKPKINIGSRGKFAVVKLFHIFYTKSLDHPYNGNRDTEKIFNLLKDAFCTDIYKDVRKVNFKKSNSKYDWN